jgi:hypothetical protein
VHSLDLECDMRDYVVRFNHSQGQNGPRNNFLMENGLELQQMAKMEL